MFPVCSHRCQTARYCSKQCARVAWAGGHKQECRAPFTLTMGPVCARVSLLAGAIVRLLAELGPDVSEEVSALSMAFSVLGRARKVEGPQKEEEGGTFTCNVQTDMRPAETGGKAAGRLIDMCRKPHPAPMLP